VAMGKTNRERADVLTIAVSTAERHLANILNKLDVRSRGQVGIWVVKHGVLEATGVNHRHPT
jgi:DNA-binding NarL/FixJ family response regulator